VPRQSGWKANSTNSIFTENSASKFFIAFQAIFLQKICSNLACVAFSCKILGQLDDLTFYKMFCGVVNVALGTFFVIIYFRYARASAIRKENRVSFA
jgi:hypothetical protein